LKFLEKLGQLFIGSLSNLVEGLEVGGRASKLFFWTIVWLFRPPFRIREFFRQMDFVAVQSVELITITGLFTGMVLALQAHIGVAKFGAEALVGAGVALSLTRELGPVLSALMVIARAGSAMAAELGSMRISQQIDALSTMAVEPIQFLVVPRFVATTLMLPLLAALFEFSGMVGAYLIFIFQLGGDGGVFMQSVRDYLTAEDIIHGLTKSMVFGAILSIICCSKGFYSTGGSRGVGVATTRAVVISSLLILASDYVMTALMFDK
jgi:phospholipid/cholesterol/gamma-HCH transport system permease protein